eukprot:GILJ01022676.1.p1 GENE.GILJ01022676.1~~GILJ01022676.1.p1  ORF type:complete len:291 (-),score=49.00 GILJ01022676.1:330-1202(-)
MNVKLPKHRYCSDGNRMPHLEYDPKDIEVVDTDKHRSPDGFGDALARNMVRAARKTFDFVTGYSRCYPSSKHTDSTPLMSTDKWLNRAIFLESIAAVPGMVAGMSRHLGSLRRMKHDEGWIRKLLEEAENERMHLFFFLTAKQPSIPLRCMVAIAQAVFFAANAFAYCISPRFAHRFVGYLEEEAVHTYTLMLEDIDRVLDEAAAAKNPSHISQWRSKPAPMDFAKYWGLEPGTATYRDVILCIRADELSHREHNHLFADAHSLGEQARVKDVLKQAHPIQILDPTKGSQ